MSAAHDSALSALLAQMSWARALARDLVNDMDRAEDLVQDVWVKALKNPPRHPNSLQAWIARVMRNRIKEDHRRESRRLELAPPEVEAESETPADTLERLETVEWLGRLVRGLPQPYQAAILLHYFEDCSWEELAERLDVSILAAQTRVRRGRELIEAQLRARADVEHRLHGLLLLAAPVLKPTGSLLLGFSAVVLVLSFLLTPFAWLLFGPSQEEAVALRPRTADSAATVPTGSDPALLTTALAPELLERRSVPTSSTVEIFVRDSECGALVPNLELRAEFCGANGEVLGTETWVSDAERPHLGRRPAHAYELRWSLAANSAYTDGGGLRMHRLHLNDHHDPIQLPIWPLRGELHGHVLDTHGLPVTTAEVGIWYGMDAESGGPPARTVPVASDGSYRVPGILASNGPSFVAAQAQGYSAQRCFTVTRLEEPDAVIEDVALVLEEGRRHRVRVETADGRAIVGARVVLWSGVEEAANAWAPNGGASGRRDYRLLTNANGETVEVTIGASPWLLEVSGAGYGPWRETLKDSADLTRVVPPSAPRLRGVVATSRRLPAPRVRVIAEGAGVWSDGWSNERGGFEIAVPGAAGAPLRLIYLPEDPALGMWITESFVPLPDGMLPMLELPEGRALQAELLTANGEAWWSNELVEVRVRGGRQGRTPEAHHEESWLATRARYEPERAWTEAVGSSLNLGGLPEDPLLVSYWSARGLLAEAELRPGSALAMIREAQYPQARIRLRMLVQSGNGMAFQGRLRLRAERAPQPGAPDGDAELVEVDASCADGACELLGLRPGVWNLQVFDHRASSVWSVQQLVIEAGAAPVLRPILEASFGGLLRLVHPDGTPVAGARVELLRMDGSLQPIAPGIEFATTDAQGLLALARLPLTQPLRIHVVTNHGERHLLEPGDLLPSQSYWRVTLPE